MFSERSQGFFILFGLVLAFANLLKGVGRQRLQADQKEPAPTFRGQTNQFFVVAESDTRLRTPQNFLWNKRLKEFLGTARLGRDIVIQETYYFPAPNPGAWQCIHFGQHIIYLTHPGFSPGEFRNGAKVAVVWAAS